jgi:hypothetical protein
VWVRELKAECCLCERLEQNMEIVSARTFVQLSARCVADDWYRTVWKWEKIKVSLLTLNGQFPH